VVESEALFLSNRMPASDVNAVIVLHTPIDSVLLQAPHVFLLMEQTEVHMGLLSSQMEWGE
jgi:hypothetical protein